VLPGRGKGGLISIARDARWSWSCYFIFWPKTIDWPLVRGMRVGSPFPQTIVNCCKVDFEMDFVLRERRATEYCQTR